MIHGLFRAMCFRNPKILILALFVHKTFTFIFQINVLELKLVLLLWLWDHHSDRIRTKKLSCTAEAAALPLQGR